MELSNKGLIEGGCPKDMIKIMQNYLSERQMTMDNGYQQVSKRVTRGCLQGSVVGPDMWNINMDDSLKKIQEGGVRLCR